MLPTGAGVRTSMCKSSERKKETLKKMFILRFQGAIPLKRELYY